MILQAIIAPILLFSSIQNNIIKEEKGRDYAFSKMEFDGHTYIYFKWSWNSAGNQLLHDPGCKCTKFDFEAFDKLHKKLIEKNRP